MNELINENHLLPRVTFLFIISLNAIMNDFGAVFFIHFCCLFFPEFQTKSFGKKKEKHSFD